MGAASFLKRTSVILPLSARRGTSISFLTRPTATCTRPIPHHPLVQLTTNFSITSMSKVYGVPGVRVGWVASRCPKLIAEVLNVREYISITNNALGEHIATEVL